MKSWLAIVVSGRASRGNEQLLKTGDRSRPKKQPKQPTGATILKHKVSNQTNPKSRSEVQMVPGPQ